jgi:uncharacterized protein (TIGR03437 family)
MPQYPSTRRLLRARPEGKRERLTGYKIRRSALALSLSCLAGAAYGQINPSTADRELKKREWFYQQRAYPRTSVPHDARLKAIKDLDSMVVQGTGRTILGQPRDPAVWKLIGPQPTLNKGIHTSGMTTAIAVDPTNDNVVYIGAPDGGVWKTSDAGAHWTPLTDSQPSMSVASIAIDPRTPDTIYVGTAAYLGTGSGGLGAGILKSKDGGSTWTNYPGAFAGPTGTDTFCGAGAEIISLAINPDDSDVLLAGVYRCPSFAGIYRSIDGGITWTQVFVGSEAVSIFFDSSTSDVVYASVGRFFTGPSNGVWKSADGGQTWTALNGGGTNTLPWSSARSVFLVQARSSPATMYVSMPGTSSNRLFKTTDGGTNWSAIALPPLARGISLAVHPSNPDILFAGAEFLYRSLDGGATWASVQVGANNIQLFGDIRSYAFSTGGHLLYVGDDGGPHVTADAANVSVNWSNLSDTLAITEFYPGFSIHPTDINVGFGGSQDQGVQKYTGSPTWNSVAWCDAFETAIDYLTPETVYADCNHNISKSTSSGNIGTWSVSQNGIDTSDRASWVRPLAIDPTDPQRLYYGTYRLYQTNDGAATWMPISPDLTHGGVLTAVLAASDSNTVYVGTSNGQVQVTTNASAGAATAWKDRSSGLPLRVVTQLTVEPANPAAAYVTFSGYSYDGDTQGHVFRTINAGATWTDISGNLPNVPANDIVIDPDLPTTLYVATDVGVFSTSDGGNTWFTLGTGLPRVSVTGLRLHRPTRVLRAGTFGRSMWDLYLSGSEQPTLLQNSVRSVANGAIPNPPGSLIYAQGTNLASVTTKPLIASSTPLPTHLQDNLDDVSVTVNGTPAPMYYALPNYVAFQLPWETDTSLGSATLVVTRNGVASAPLPFSVGKFSPGIFTTTADGKGLAWAIFAAPSKINPNGLVAQANSVGNCPGPAPTCYLGVPAAVGDTLYLYAGGLGPVGPKTLADGQAPCPLNGGCPGYNPTAYSTTTKPTITVGGVQAAVTFAGLHPVYPGLYLVYFNIPSGVPKGNAVAVQLTINGIGTDPANVTIAIH